MNDDGRGQKKQKDMTARDDGLQKPATIDIGNASDLTDGRKLQTEDSGMKTCLPKMYDCFVM